MLTLRDNWRWMVKSNASIAAGRKLTSRAAGEAAPVLLNPGKSGCGSVGVSAGIGAVGPPAADGVSPTRNALVALAEPVAPQVPTARFWSQDTGWMRPRPSSGSSTWVTPFKRAY